MDEHVVTFLRCPICAGDLAASRGVVRCAAGHSFDIARQGYVNLLPGGARPASADTAAMVRAREEFLGADHLRSLADVLADDAMGLYAGERQGNGGCVVDVGAGTGYYLAAVLDRTCCQVGLALDLSKHATARAAHAHRGIGAVVCDVWRPLPVRTGVASLLLNVCAPRNGAEFRRIVRPDGALLVATPAPSHLGELVEALGMLSVDTRKKERVGGALDAHFEAMGRTMYETQLRLTRDEAGTLALMGPSAHHLDPATLRVRLAALPDTMDVTASFEVCTYRPRC